MPFTDVENPELQDQDLPEDQDLQNQSPLNEKLDVFFDKLINNPVARTLNQFGKLLYANNKLFIRSFVNYGMFRTFLSSAGCMPKSPFEIDDHKCLFTNREDPLIKDNELFSVAIATLFANIALTAVFACARKSILENEGRDIVEDILPINPQGDEAIRETQLKMADITPSLAGSTAVFLFSLADNPNSPIHFSNLFLHLTSQCFFYDKFLSLPKEDFLGLMKTKSVESNITLRQAPDLAGFQNVISSHFERREPRSPLPIVGASIGFVETREQQRSQR